MSVSIPKVMEDIYRSYPDINLKQRIYLDTAVREALETLLQEGRANALENAREDNPDIDEAEESEITGKFYVDNMTPDSVYEVARDVARFVMYTWHVVHKYDADKVGYHFVMTRNGAGVGFWDESEYPENGTYLDFVTEQLFAFPWHCELDGEAVSVYAA